MSSCIGTCLYAQTFCCGYANRPQRSGKNATRIRKLLKTLFKAETCVEDATNPDTCGRTVMLIAPEISFLALSEPF